MELTIQIESDRGLLCATYSGEFSLPEAEITFHEILDGLVKHKLKKVLIDGRQLTGNLQPLERFYYGKYVADAVAHAVNRNKIEVPRFAYVLQKPMLDPNRFGETVAVNRGMRVKTFEKIEQAEWWLDVAQD